MQAEHKHIMLSKNYENGCDALCACVKGADGGHEYMLVWGMNGQCVYSLTSWSACMFSEANLEQHMQATLCPINWFPWHPSSCHCSKYTYVACYNLAMVIRCVRQYLWWWDASQSTWSPCPCWTWGLWTIDTPVRWWERMRPTSIPSTMSNTVEPS